MHIRMHTLGHEQMFNQTLQLPGFHFRMLKDLTPTLELVTEYFLTVSLCKWLKTPDYR